MKGLNGDFWLFQPNFWPYLNSLQPLIGELYPKYIIVGLGIHRVFEILFVQINALLFDYYRNTRERIKASKIFANPEKPKPYAIRGYIRITILLLHNFAEIIFWFSIFYRFFGFSFAGSNIPIDLITAISFSFYTMATFGHYANVSVKDYNLTLVQAVIGLFMALLILSRFIGLLPRGPTSDKVEQEMEKGKKIT